MIPAFNDHGYLPPGVHLATIDEIESRFGIATPKRRELMQSLRWLIERCELDDVLRLVVNGSFVTDKTDPEDIDCIALIGPTFGSRAMNPPEWHTPIPFVHLELADAIIFQEYIDRIFGLDASLVPKGMVEAI